MGENYYNPPFNSILNRDNEQKNTYLAEHNKFVNNRLLKFSNGIVKELYDEYKEQILISSAIFNGTAHYNHYSKAIKFNALDDINNPEGSCSTYFHEVGHMIDDFAGNGHAWLSSEPSFRTALENDVKNHVSDVMNKYSCSLDEAYDIISIELEGNILAGVSDIYGSLTDCKCQGDWGHSRNYWQLDSTRVEKEAFANMFEASLGFVDKMNAMKKYLPTAYSKFENIIKYR